MEVLDPEQNSTFNDHYLDMDYDLSDIPVIGHVELRPTLNNKPYNPFIVAYADTKVVLNHHSTQNYQ